MKISAGACNKYTTRVVKALVSLQDEYIQWPDEKERNKIATRIEKAWMFKNCVGLMDGTLFELALAPRSSDGSDYHGRKFQYSLSIMVINDDQREITAYLSGFPGCTRDNRVWKDMDQYQSPEKFSTSLQYILTDTAFTPSGYCIQTYKALTGFVQDRDEHHFNTSLA